MFDKYPDHLLVFKWFLWFTQWHLLQQMRAL